MEERKKESSFRDVLTVIFKHKFKILAFFIVAVVVSPIAHLAFVRHYAVYEASSLLMIRYGREYTRPSLSGEPTTLQVGLPEILNSEIAILSSRDLKEKVINKLGLDYIYPNASKLSSKTMSALDIAILLFNKGMTVQGMRDSNIITVSFRHKDPKVAAAVLNQLVDSYQEKRLEVLTDSKPVIFLEQKVAEYGQKLKESQSRTDSFRQKNLLVSFDDQRNQLLQERMKLDLTMKATQTQIKELSQKLSSLESQTKTFSSTVGSITQEKEAELSLLTLQQKEQELLSKFTESNALIAGVRNQIKLTKNFIEERQKRNANSRVATNEFYQELQRDIIVTRADLSMMNVRSKDLQHRSLEIEHELESFDSKEDTFRDLRREWATNESNYQTYQAYMKKLEEARISAEMDKQKMTSVSVIERAAVPSVRVSPRQSLPYFVAIAALAGVGAGIGLAFILEFFRQGFHTRQKVEKSLGIPVLTAIPHRSV